MVISQEKIEELKKICEQNVELKITGFNGLGFRYETEARITRDDSTAPGVYDNCIYFEFGNVRCTYAPQRTDLIAPFIINYDKKYNSPEHTLIIEKITLPTGEVILENTDAEKYFKMAEQDAIAYDKKLKKEGRDIVKIDPVTEKLPGMIGKPLIVDNIKRGILVNFLDVSNKGSVVVDFLLGPGVCNDFIEKDTRVRTTDLHGNISLVEVNGKTQEECKKIDEIFEERKLRILEASNAKSQTGPQ